MAMLTSTALALGGLVIAASSAGYGVYAGERAKSASERAMRNAQAEAAAQRTQEQQQMADNERRQQELYDKQVAEQAATRERVTANSPA